MIKEIYLIVLHKLVKQIIARTDIHKAIIINITIIIDEKYQKEVAISKIIINTIFIKN